MNDPAVAAQVVYESEIAEKLGAHGTPGFFVNGKPLLGWGSYAGFQSVVEQALGEARRLGVDGVPAEKVAEVATAAEGERGELMADLLWGVKKE
jgi:hypothetical protein